MPAKTASELREQAMCAYINLQNLSNAVPGLRAHPFFKIVRYQLACASVEKTEDEPKEIE